MKPSIALIVCALPLLLAPLGCGDSSSDAVRRNVDCAPCPGPLAIEVAALDSGLPVPEATISGLDAPCITEDRGSGAITVCVPSFQQVHGPGTYEFTVSAPGFLTVLGVAVVPPSSGSGPCDCGYVSTRVEVALPGA